MSTYPKWLREAASKGGKTSKRKLSKKEARRIANLRWAGAAGEKRSDSKRRAKSNVRISDGANVE